MIEIILLIIGLIVGAIIGWFAAKSKLLQRDNSNTEKYDAWYARVLVMQLKYKLIFSHDLLAVTTLYNTESNKRRQRFYLININPP